MKLAILTAMTVERERIAALMDSKISFERAGYDWTCGKIGENDVFLASGGIGKVNAALVASAAIELFAPDAVVSTGCAGGLSADLKVGDVVAGSVYVYHDFDCTADGASPIGQIPGGPRFFNAAPDLVDAARAAGAAVGLVASGDQFITPGPRLDEIRRNFPEALACEMESAAIAHACARRGVKFISFRVLSDSPGTSSENAAQYEDFWAFLAEKSFGTTRRFLEILDSDAPKTQKPPAPAEKIASFTINHETLLRGIYVSRRDDAGGTPLTTFDIRMKEPNREEPLGVGALHTIEHLGATYLRNQPVWKDKIVYFGPMGCLTGCYLVMQGKLESADILDLMRETFNFIASFEGAIPGAAPRDCGNWSLHDLAGAKRESAKFLTEILANPAPANLSYPA